MREPRYAINFLAALFAMLVFLGPLHAQNADIVFTGGKVYTVNEKQRWAEAGKRADLIVLANNIFETKPEELSKTRVLLTLLNGEPVWGATNFEKVTPTGKSVEYGDYVTRHNCNLVLPGVWRTKVSPPKANE